MFAELAQATPELKEYGIIGAVVVSMLSAIGLMLKWLTSYVSKQEETFRDERKQDRESWQEVAREWKDCHREGCDKMDRALTELTQAIRENKQ